MKAIILTGGKGLRLRKVLRDLPKPMAPVAGRPFLEYLILQLAKWEIREIVLSVGYKRDIIKSHFGNGERLGVRILYSEEDRPLGTGGAVRKAFSSVNDEQFIVMNGDSFLDLNFKDFISFHNNQHAQATIALVNVPDVSRFGRVEINNRYEVVNFMEKNDGGNGFINGGIYIFNYGIIDSIPEGRVSLEDEIFPSIIKNGLKGMVINSFFVDIGMPNEYLALCRDPKKIFNNVKI